MSTLFHADLFKCHHSLFCPRGTGETKRRGVGENGGEGAVTDKRGASFFRLKNQMTRSQLDSAGSSFNT